MAEHRLVAEPARAAPGDLVYLFVEGQDSGRLVGGLRSELTTLEGEVLYLLTARLDRTDAGYARPESAGRYKLIGIGGTARLPARIPPLPPGRYVVRRTFLGRALPVPAIPDDWKGDPEDHPFSVLRTRETVSLTAEIEIVDRW